MGEINGSNALRIRILLYLNLLLNQQEIRAQAAIRKKLERSVRRREMEVQMLEEKLIRLDAEFEEMRKEREAQEARLAELREEMEKEGNILVTEGCEETVVSLVRDHGLKCQFCTMDPEIQRKLDAEGIVCALIEPEPEPEPEP